MNSVTVMVPLTIRRRGGRKQIIGPDGAVIRAGEDGTGAATTHGDPALVKALARAFRWRRMLEEGRYGTIDELAAAEKINPSYLSRLLRLTLLAPEIIEAILDGRQPEGITLPGLMEPFPVEWGQQSASPSTSEARLQPDIGRAERCHSTEPDLEIGHPVAVHIAFQHPAGEAQLPCHAPKAGAANPGKSLITGQPRIRVDRAQVNLVTLRHAEIGNDVTIGLDSTAKDELISIKPARHAVSTEAALQQIQAGAAVQRVITREAIERIIARTAIEDIGASIAIQPVGQLIAGAGESGRA